MAAQTRLEIVELRGRQGFNELGRDRLLAHPQSFLEGSGEVLPDLQRCPQAIGEQLDSFVGDDVAGGNPDAAIIHEGTITAKDAGLVALVAPTVENTGTRCCSE